MENRIAEHMPFGPVLATEPGLVGFYATAEKDQ